MPNKRFEFRSDPRFDLALVTEANSINPYAFEGKKCKAAWMEIAENLQKSDLKLPVTERSCKDRMKILLDDYHRDESLSHRASGVDEKTLTEMKHTLEKIDQLIKSKSPTIKQLYKKSNRKLAESTRNQALVAVDESSSHSDPSEETENMVDEDDESKTNNKHDQAEPEPDASTSGDKGPPSKRFRRGDGFAYLEAKHKRETELKDKELSNQKLKAENKKMELELQSKRQEIELKLKEAELQERSAMTQALLSLLQKK